MYCIMSIISYYFFFYDYIYHLYITYSIISSLYNLFDDIWLVLLHIYDDLLNISKILLTCIILFLIFLLILILLNHDIMNIYYDYSFHYTYKCVVWLYEIDEFLSSSFLIYLWLYFMTIISIIIINIIYLFYGYFFSIIC